ncbi:MAG TPA: hypothetical protein VGN90_17040 [Pyrinomonadaceae bacterium]|jgi:hypothetical protein|nr:hypothetical protein [Pyrinomonadaceae bacterium]
MYCSTCGVAVTQGLSYCNYCGAKLGGAGDDGGESSEVKPGLLVCAMVGLFIFGLVAIAMLLGMMKAILNFNTGTMLFFSLLSFLILISLEGLFVRLLLSRRRGPEQAGNTLQLKGQATKELDAAPARVLPEPVSSVTEHTTRTFAPVYNERTSK